MFNYVSACGKANHADAEVLISHGAPTDHGEYPWHVGLYRKNERGDWEQNCGGTLINPHIVLTGKYSSEIAYVIFII